MGFLKKLFTGKEDDNNGKNEKKFDILKYDGIKALSSCSCNVDYAIACFTHALDIREDVETREYLAKALLAKGDETGALEIYKKLQELQPEEPLHHIRMAQVAFQMEDYHSMEIACNNALAINRNLALPHYLLAMKARANHDVFSAIAETTKAISAKPDFYDAYMLRAQILYTMHQYAEADKDINIILSNTEPTEETVMLKGQICASLDKNEEAKESFQTVIEFNPFAISAYTELATLLIRIGNNDEAEQIISEALEHNPECAELYKIRGAAKYAKGDTIGATEDIKKSLEIAPEEAEKYTGEFTNFKKKMLDAYNNINPYNIGIKI